MNKITLTVSSRTGNTKKIADAAIDFFEQQNHQVEIVELDAFMKKTNLEPSYEKESLNSSLLVLCFWCDRSNLDTGSKRFLQIYGEKSQVLALGTFGGYPDSPYADKVRNNVAKTIEEAGGICQGVYLSQGKVRTDNIEVRRNLPVGNPHRLDDAGVARVLESQKHPNQRDIERAKDFCLTALQKLNLQ